METILIVVVLLSLFGSGGYYWDSRGLVVAGPLPDPDTLSVRCFDGVSHRAMVSTDTRKMAAPDPLRLH